MSELKVNKITPATGTAFTFGDSGDTFSIPSGATFANNGTATGFGAGGKVLQIQYTINSTYSATTNVVIPFDDTIPQSSEGTTAGVDVAITPANASNILLIQGSICAAHGASGDMNSALFQDSTANALAAWKIESDNQAGNHFDVTHIFYVMLAGTTSATTFKVHVGPPADNGTTYINGGQSSGRKYGGVSRSILSVMELSP